MTTPADAPTEPGGDAWFGNDAIGLGARMSRYELIRLVGMGGMGVVFEARDPELDRIVAVKVLRDAGPGSAGEARLRREGQTMARLTHPNVIRVYDVGVSHGHVFVAMEFVRGGTLADWIARAPRTPAEIVAAFVHAGRGLAAAHDAGLVHRDFKPANVLVGDDGRVLVTDFGLARATGDSIPPPTEPTVPGKTAAPASKPPDRPQSGELPVLTQTGHFVGTPGYMAPEQYSGAMVDARADQFGFCVSLWRGLYGSAPYAGSTVDEMVSSAEKGALVDPPATTAARVAPRIRAAIQRGLAADPAARFPSMHALLAVLEPRPSRMWMWAAGAGAAVAIAVTVAAVTRDGASASLPPPDPCPPPDSEIAAVWSGDRAAKLRAHLTKVDPETGGKRYDAAAAVLDSGVSAWRDTHVAACRATRVDGKQSDSLLDARMTCLREWLDQAGGVASELERAADRERVEAAIKGVGAIAPLARCSDTSSMMARSQFPTAPQARAESDAIQLEGRAITQARKAGELDDLVGRADALIARARKLDNPATLTKAIGVRWRVAVVTGDVNGAIAHLRELTEIAARGHDDVEAANAWALMARLTAMSKGQPDEAKVMLSAARAAAARAGDPPEVLAEVLITEGDVLNMAGDYEGALAASARARELLVAVGADKAGSPLAPKLAALLQTVSNIHWFKDDTDAALPPLREALAMWDRAYGPDTIESSGVLLDLAQVLSERREWDASLRAARDGLAIRERRGESQLLAGGLMIQCEVEREAGNVDASIAICERGLAIARKTMAPEDLPAEEIRIAASYDFAGDTRKALAIYVASLAAIEKSGMRTINVPIWWTARARLEHKLGRCEDAIVSYRKAADAARELEGDDSYFIGLALRGKGECLGKLGRKNEAVAALREGLAFRIPPYAAADAALSRGVLGTLLGDAVMVRDAVAALGDTTTWSPRTARDPRVAQLRTWIAKQK